MPGHTGLNVFSILSLFQILCRYCGAQGIHLQCGNLPGNVEHPKWTCASCKKVLSALPPTYINHYSRVMNDCTKVDTRARNLLRNTTFTLQDGRLVAQNVSVRMVILQCISRIILCTQHLHNSSPAHFETASYRHLQMHT